MGGRSCTPGRSQVVFLAIPPVDLLVPGLRQIVGATSVQIVMELVEDRELPGQLETGDGYGNRISGWYAKTKYAAAMLGDDDSVRLVLMRGGRQRVLARLGIKDGVRPVEVDLGEVEVRLVPGTGPQRVVVTADAARVQQGMAEFTQRRAATGAGR